jgi:putative SOS response-associated peptidase YedK
MCGRYTVTVDPEAIYGAFGFDESDEDGPGGHPGAPYGGDLVRPRYNIAPTDQVPVVLDRSTGGDRHEPVRRLEAMRWGLIPGWAKDTAIGARQFNLRAETLGTKFRPALERRRCLLPASGFYEWQRIEGPAKGRRPAKQAYYLTPVDGSLLALAGLWEFWRSPSGEPVRSAAIITVPSAGRMRQVHDRMPLMLAPDAWGSWLSLTGDADSVADLLTASGDDAVDVLEFRPVGDRVGNVRNDDAELIQAVEPAVDLDGAPADGEPPADGEAPAVHGQAALFT